MTRPRPVTQHFIRTRLPDENRNTFRLDRMANGVGESDRAGRGDEGDDGMETTRGTCPVSRRLFVDGPLPPPPPPLPDVASMSGMPYWRQRSVWLNSFQKSDISGFEAGRGFITTSSPFCLRRLFRCPDPPAGAFPSPLDTFPLGCSTSVAFSMTPGSTPRRGLMDWVMSWTIVALERSGESSARSRRSELAGGLENHTAMGPLAAVKARRSPSSPSSSPFSSAWHVLRNS